MYLVPARTSGRAAVDDAPGPNLARHVIGLVSRPDVAAVRARLGGTAQEMARPKACAGGGRRRLTGRDTSRRFGVARSPHEEAASMRRDEGRTPSYANASAEPG